MGIIPQDTTTREERLKASTFSIHDLERQKNQIVQYTQMQAMTGQIMKSDYKKVVSERLVKMYKRHAKFVGNDNKYLPGGARNPYYLWDHLKLEDDGTIAASEPAGAVVEEEGHGVEPIAPTDVHVGGDSDGNE